MGRVPRPRTSRARRTARHLLAVLGGGLDAILQQQLPGLLDDLRDRLGMAVLLISHDLGVTASRADRVAVMYAGRVVESAATAAGEQPAIGLPVPDPLPAARCPLAQDICAVQEPQLAQTGATGQLAACHFPLPPPGS